MVTALRLPSVILSSFVEDIEARDRGPALRLGQTGAHRRCELSPHGEPRFGQGSLDGPEHVCWGLTSRNARVRLGSGPFSGATINSSAAFLAPDRISY